MTILFMYDSPLLPEKGGTERATKLVMDELARQGHRTMGLLHFNQANPDEYFLNGERIPSLIDFLNENHVDVVVNQIAFHYWLLKEFLAHGGQEWKNKGGKIISFMHFDPTGSRPLPVRDLMRDVSKKSLAAKIKRIGMILFYRPILIRRARKTGQMSSRYIYDNSDAYVVMSPSYIAPFVKKAGLQETTKMHVITNMLTFPEIADRRCIFQKGNKVVVVARMDEQQKRISAILRVWHSIDPQDWTLQIIGTGKDAEFYQELVAKKHIRNVEFLGHQNPWPYYQNAKIFLMSSPREGWGLTITESMQNGTVPIVLNTSAVFRDIVRDGIDGFLPDDEHEMAKRLTLLMNDGQLLNQMAEAALEGAARFSSEKVGEQWNDLLNLLTR
ncbi:MAG: glycosyltransferase [Prevotella sp.]